MLTLWTIGSIATFGVMLLIDFHEDAAEQWIAHEGMPLWALQMSIALACAALWPLMLVLLAVDCMAHIMGDK